MRLIAMLERSRSLLPYAAYRERARRRRAVRAAACAARRSAASPRPRRPPGSDPPLPAPAVIDSGVSGTGTHTRRPASTRRRPARCRALVAVLATIDPGRPRRSVARARATTRACSRSTSAPDRALHRRRRHEVDRRRAGRSLRHRRHRLRRDERQRPDLRRRRAARDGRLPGGRAGRRRRAGRDRRAVSRRARRRPESRSPAASSPSCPRWCAVIRRRAGSTSWAPRSAPCRSTGS